MTDPNKINERNDHLHELHAKPSRWQDYVFYTLWWSALVLGVVVAVLKVMIGFRLL